MNSPASSSPGVADAPPAAVSLDAVACVDVLHLFEGVALASTPHQSPAGSPERAAAHRGAHGMPTLVPRPGAAPVIVNQEELVSILSHTVAAEAPASSSVAPSPHSHPGRVGLVNIILTAAPPPGHPSTSRGILSTLTPALPELAAALRRDSATDSARWPHDADDGDDAHSGERGAGADRAGWEGTGAGVSIAGYLREVCGVAGVEVLTYRRRLPVSLTAGHHPPLDAALAILRVTQCGPTTATPARPQPPAEVGEGGEEVGLVGMVGSLLRAGLRLVLRECAEIARHPVVALRVLLDLDPLHSAALRRAWTVAVARYGRRYMAAAEGNVFEAVQVVAGLADGEVIGGHVETSPPPPAQPAAVHLIELEVRDTTESPAPAGGQMTRAPHAHGARAEGRAGTTAAAARGGQEDDPATRDTLITTSVEPSPSEEAQPSPQEDGHPGDRGGRPSPSPSRSGSLRRLQGGSTRAGPRMSGDRRPRSSPSAPSTSMLFRILSTVLGDNAARAQESVGPMDVFDPDVADIPFSQIFSATAAGGTDAVTGASGGYGEPWAAPWTDEPLPSHMAALIYEVTREAAPGLGHDAAVRRLFSRWSGVADLLGSARGSSAGHPVLPPPHRRLLILLAADASTLATALLSWTRRPYAENSLVLPILGVAPVVRHGGDRRRTPDETASPASPPPPPAFSPSSALKKRGAMGRRSTPGARGRLSVTFRDIPIDLETGKSATGADARLADVLRTVCRTFAVDAAVSAVVCATPAAAHAVRRTAPLLSDARIWSPTAAEASLTEWVEGRLPRAGSSGGAAPLVRLATSGTRRPLSAAADTLREALDRSMARWCGLAAELRARPRRPSVCLRHVQPAPASSPPRHGLGRAASSLSEAPPALAVGLVRPVTRQTDTLVSGSDPLDVRQAAANAPPVALLAMPGAGRGPPTGRAPLFALLAAEFGADVLRTAVDVVRTAGPDYVASYRCAAVGFLRYDLSAWLRGFVSVALTVDVLALVQASRGGAGEPLLPPLWGLRCTCTPRPWERERRCPRTGEKRCRHLAELLYVFLVQQRVAGEGGPWSGAAAESVGSGGEVVETAAPAASAVGKPPPSRKRGRAGVGAKADAPSSSPPSAAEAGGEKGTHRAKSRRAPGEGDSEHARRPRTCVRMCERTERHTGKESNTQRRNRADSVGVPEAGEARQEREHNGEEQKSGAGKRKHQCKDHERSERVGKCRRLGYEGGRTKRTGKRAPDAKEAPSRAHRDGTQPHESSMDSQRLGTAPQASGVLDDAEPLFADPESGSSSSSSSERATSHRKVRRGRCRGASSLSAPPSGSPAESLALSWLEDVTLSH